MTDLSPAPSALVVLRVWDPVDGAGPHVVWAADRRRRRAVLVLGVMGALVAVALAFAGQYVAAAVVLAVGGVLSVVLGRGGLSGYYEADPDGTPRRRLVPAPVELASRPSRRP